MATQGIRWQEKLRIDDPVGAFPTHALASVWGLVATALFCEPTEKFTSSSGLVKGGSWKFLGVQILAILCCSAWAAITTFLLLCVIDKVIGIRMSEEEEELGADYYVHDIKPPQNGVCSNNDRVINENQQSSPSEQISEHESTSGIDTNKLKEIDSVAFPKTFIKKSNAVHCLSKSDFLSKMSIDQTHMVNANENSGYETT